MVKHVESAEEPVVEEPSALVEEKKPRLLHEGQILVPDGSVSDVRGAERFRIIRASIDRKNLGKKRAHVLAVTSSVPEEGKSMIAVNLARAFAVDPIKKSLIIDCDLRRPTTHKFFGVSPAPGLTDVLVGSAELKDVIRSVEPGLDIITAGNPVNDPHRAVEQPLLGELLRDLKSQYRYVIIDCPPVLLCPEPITLSSVAEATLLVVRAWRTEKTLVNDALNVLGKDAVMGIIMNDATEPLSQYGYYRYYGSSHTSSSGSKKKRYLNRAAG